MIRSLFCVALMLVAFPLHGETARTLTWDDLLPEGEIELLDQLYQNSGQPQFFGHSGEEDWGSIPEQIGTFNTVPELNGAQVRLPGFVLPLEYSVDGKVTDFLLVPYMGACIHEPPPPPNQIVFVETPGAVDFGAVWAPVWITGVMSAERVLNGLGDSAYSLKMESWEVYER